MKLNLFKKNLGVNPKGVEWHAYPREVPTKEINYLCTLSDGKMRYLEVLYYCKNKNNRIGDVWDGRGFYSYSVFECNRVRDVLAWAEVQPYKGE